MSKLELLVLYCTVLSQHASKFAEQVDALLARVEELTSLLDATVAAREELTSDSGRSLPADFVKVRSLSTFRSVKDKPLS